MADGKVEIDLELNDKGIPSKARETGEKAGKGFKEGFQDNSEGAPKKAKTELEELTSTVSKQSNELKKLKDEYKNVYLEQGESSDKAKELEEKIVQLDAELDDNKRKLKEADDATERLGKSQDKAADDADELGKAQDEAGRKTDALVGKLKGVAGAIAGAFAIDKIVEFSKAAVDAAAEISAEESAYEQIMGDYADKASEKLNKVADDTGIISSRMTGNMTSMTAKFKGLGYGVEDATDLAARGLTLAADGAAFWDMSLDESQEHLNSFINGSYEGGEAIGLFANDTQMAAYAVEQGLIDETKEWANLDEATKQATRLEYAENMYAMSEVTGQAAREADQYANVMANAAENLRQLMGVIGTPIKDSFIAPIVAEASTAFETLAPMLEGGMFSGAGTVVADTLSNIINIIIGLIPEVLNAGVQFIGGLGLGIVENLPYIFLTVVEAITTAVPMLLSSLLDLASEIVTALPDIFLSVVEAIPQVIQMLATALPESVGILVSGFTTLFEGIVEAMPEIIQILVDSLPMIIEMLASFLGENAPIMVNGFIQLFMAFLDALPMIINLVIVNMPVIIMAIVNALISNMPVLANGFIQAFTAFLTALPAIIGTIVSALPSIIAAIVSTLSSQGSSQLPGVASRIFQAFIGGIAGMIGSIASAAASVGSSVVESLSGALTGLAGIGENAIRGLVEGMGNMVGWAIGQVQSFGSSIINGLKNFLGIHSPSTLMRDEVGKYMAEGMVVGFVDTDPMDKIKRSITAGVDNLKLMSESGNTTTTNNNSQVININQPVKSPDEVSRELRMQRRYGLAGNEE